MTTINLGAVRQDQTHTAHFDALGTTATVAVTRRECLPDAVASVQSTVAVFDEACSRFRDDSELEAVNAAAGEPVAVGPLLLEAVAAALRAASLTDGDVDPTVGRALIALGYDRDFSALASVPPGGRSPRPAFTDVPGWRTVRLDEEAQTIHLPRGVRLDLGATAKALAADRAATKAADICGCEVLVSLGGDIATAGAPLGGWPVRVTDDHRGGESAPGQWIAVHGGGLATSSVETRSWQMPWGPAHHVIDPGTGKPASGPWRTVSVAAASCVDANAASTAAIVRGELARQWLTSMGLPSRLVRRDGRVRHLAGWPTAGDDLG
ncbi:MAG: FAD:protein FMN transferase [Solirubrobacteraceae bacterium]